MKIAVVDNYDSFSYNLEQYVGEFAEVEVGSTRSHRRRTATSSLPVRDAPETFL